MRGWVSLSVAMSTSKSSALISISTFFDNERADYVKEDGGC